MSPMVRRPPGIEIALLGFLRDGPEHGYQIHQMVSDPAGLGLIWNLKQSQLYSLLAKLELDGLVSSVIQNQDPHPPRRVFKLTGAGRKVYLDWLTGPVAVPRLIRQEFLAKLYLLQNDTESFRLLVDRQMTICQRWLDEFTQESSKFEPGSFGVLTLQYRISHTRSIIAWLETLTPQPSQTKIGIIP